MTRAFFETPPVGPAAQRAASLAGAIPVLRTERLTLRGPVIGDFDTYAEILGGPRGRFIGDGAMPRAEIWADFCSMIAIWTLRGHGMWTITGPAPGPLGFVMIGAEPGDLAHELGYLVTEAAEGQSVAFEAAAAARDWAWADLEVPQLVSYIAQGNARSIALAHRLGAVENTPEDWPHPGTLAFSHPNPKGGQ